MKFLFIILFSVACSSVKRLPTSVPEEHDPIGFSCAKKSLWPAHPGLETQEFFPAKEGRLISDTFLDACGNYYRAYWNSGVKGRTRIEKVGRNFKGQFETGPTHSVPVKEFLYLTELKSEDVDKLTRLRNEAFRSGFRLIQNAFIKD